MRQRAGVALRWTGVRVLVAVALIVTLGLSAYLGAQHVADSLTITMRTLTVSCAGPPSCLQQTTLLFSKTFNDVAVAQRVQDILNNDVPFKELGFTETHSGLCNSLTGIANDYTFTFQRWGITLQVARVNSWCPIWDIHTLGIPDAWNRVGGVEGALTEIARVTHMPPPPPPPPPGAYVS
jgi:hypothetical protein